MAYSNLLKFSIICAVPLIMGASAVSYAQKSAPATLTLTEALTETYQQNPDMEAARAELRAIDELYAQASSGYKPTIDGIADYTSNYSSYSGGGATSDPKTLQLSMSQPLYRGGSTMANVSSAYNQIKAGRAKLKVTEQNVLLNAIRAYMNLISDQEIVQLNINNEKVLDTHLKATREQFELGQLTKTDVSQAESRLARATATRITAEGAVQRSRATFEQVIGLAPTRLEKPVILPPLPTTQGDALAVALNNNPNIILARYSQEAIKDTTRSIEGERLPQIDLTGAIGKIYDPSNTSSSNLNSRSVGVRATVPFYTGGNTTSRIRQSKQTENQFRMQLYSTERLVRQAVVEAWEIYTAAIAETKAVQKQIDAAKLALEGVQVEKEFGTRTVLNVLDAEQEYLDAQVTYVTAETLRIIAAYGILATTGNLTAEGLKLGVPVYDPVKNFQNVNKVGSGDAPARFRGDFRKLETQPQ